MRKRIRNAKLTREAAEIAVAEYEEGILAGETAEIQGEVKLAAAELDLAEAELEAAKAIPGDNKLQIKRGNWPGLAPSLPSRKAFPGFESSRITPVQKGKRT